MSTHGFVFDYETQSVRSTKNSFAVSLTPSESRLLLFLTQSKGNWIPQESLLTFLQPLVSEDERSSNDMAKLRQHIYEVRRKLAYICNNGNENDFEGIQTNQGFGYRFVEPGEERSAGGVTYIRLVNIGRVKVKGVVEEITVGIVNAPEVSEEQIRGARLFLSRSRNLLAKSRLPDEVDLYTTEIVSHPEAQYVHPLFIFDYVTREVTSRENGKKVRLGVREFLILQALLNKENSIIPSQRIVSVMGLSPESSLENVRVSINTLRDKLELIGVRNYMDENGQPHEVIENIPGKGYRLVQDGIFSSSVAIYAS